MNKKGNLKRKGTSSNTLIKAKNSASGITLIALVVTIIVLIILAGISINLILGENGIIKKATEAKNETQIAKEKEQIQLAAAAASIIIETDKTANAEEVFLAELEDYFGEGKVELESLGETNYKVTVVDSGREYEVDLTSGIANQTGETIKVVYPTQEDYADVEETDASYFVFDSSTGAITSLANIDKYYTNEVTYPSTIKVPEKIDGVTVTSVVLSAGAEITEVTDIVLPDTVTVIGECAFSNMTNLKNIVMPSNLETIKRSAFASCTSVEAIKIANTVTLIEEHAFNLTSSLKEIVITSDNITLQDNAFFNSGIINATISGKNVALQDIFKKCDNLINIKMGEVSASYDDLYGVGVIFNCKKLAYVEIEDAKGIIIKECPKLTTVKVGNLSGELGIKKCDSLTNVEIGEYTTEATLQVQYCNSLKELTIPNSIKEYGEYNDAVCQDLYGLEKLTIPADFTGLTGDIIYEDMPFLKEIVIPNGGNYVYENGILYNKDKTELIWVSSTSSNATVTIEADYYGELSKSEVTSYYEDNNHIRTIKIAEGVTKIGDHAFVGGKYTSIILPTTLKEIGAYAFSGLKITEIDIPKGVTTIGEGAFQDCLALRSITIPSNVTTIEAKVFYNCHSLESINISKGVTSIGDYAFSDCESLTTITIPDSVTSIGSWTFSECTRLTTITIPDSVTSIGGYAFYRCTGLTTITIPDSVTSIGDYAFQSCSNLTINCEATSQPSGWSTKWNYRNYAGSILVPVKWGQ